MLSIPIAFILCAALVLVSASLWRRQRDWRQSGPFLFLLALSALQALLVGLRWDFGWSQLRIGQVLVAAALPPTAWIVFTAAVSGRASVKRSSLWHATLPVLATLALLFAPDAIDPLLVSGFAFYGFLFVRLARGDDVTFGQTAFDGMFHMRRALWLLAFTLLGSAAIDLLVFADFLVHGGSGAALLIGLGNLAWLLALGVAVALGSAGVADPPEPRDAEPPPAGSAEADRKTAERIAALLMETSLIKDPALNLSRLARRAGLPARTVSNAINRVHRCNVSQYINGLRIGDACQRLRDPGVSITQAIYACGFQSKSNFNREFLRVTGVTPKAWRKANGA